MPIPCISGYSRKTIEANLASLLRGGYVRHDAIRTAFNAARASYFKKHPNGALPIYLAYPKNRRTAEYYMPNGAVIHEPLPERNPVRELAIGRKERDDIQRDVQKQVGGQGKAVRDSAALYTEFTGHNEVFLDKVEIPGYPDAVLAFGQCDGIMYTTVRDGITEKYIHKFKASSRPLLAASPDGKQLYLIGGSYDFTDRGIVDS